jgi:putative addiction module component (TIGR02574 family)
VPKSRQDVLSDAIQLPIEDRAAIAAELIASLDGEADPDAEQAWASEIERRADSVRSGDATARPWSEVRDRLAGRDQ